MEASWRRAANNPWHGGRTSREFAGRGKAREVGMERGVSAGVRMGERGGAAGM